MILRCAKQNLILCCAKQKGAVTVFSWGACMTFEVLEGSMLELSTRRHHKSATFVQTQLLYQFEVHVPRKFHLHFLVLFFRVSLLVCCVCVQSGEPVRGAATWLHWAAVVPARRLTRSGCTGLLLYWHGWPTQLCYTAAPA